MGSFALRRHSKVPKLLLARPAGPSRADPKTPTRPSGYWAGHAGLTRRRRCRVVSRVSYRSSASPGCMMPGRRQYPGVARRPQCTSRSPLATSSCRVVAAYLVPRRLSPAASSLCAHFLCQTVNNVIGLLHWIIWM